MAILRCCLCGSNASAVERAIVHPNGTMVCERCVLRCVEVLASGQDEPEGPDFLTPPPGQGATAQLGGGVYVG